MKLNILAQQFNNRVLVSRKRKLYDFDCRLTLIKIINGMSTFFLEIVLAKNRAQFFSILYRYFEHLMNNLHTSFILEKEIWLIL